MHIKYDDELGHKLGQCVQVDEISSALDDELRHKLGQCVQVDEISSTLDDKLGHGIIRIISSELRNESSEAASVDYNGFK